MKGTLGCSKTVQRVTLHRDSMYVLTKLFDYRVISKGLWSSRLPDLSIQDFFSLRISENVTFMNNLHTIDELKSNILHAISDINSCIHCKVSINPVNIVRLSKRFENGHQFEHVL
ncbi:uncharacterized protein TNCV_2983311 [Trichonephila clavipes]|nr:uncharacterized protein TNCV_2983311 [Trichonephila clavipes]